MPPQRVGERGLAVAVGEKRTYSPQTMGLRKRYKAKRKRGRKKKSRGKAYIQAEIKKKVGARFGKTCP